MNRWLLLLLACFGTTAAMAQDLIVLRSGTTLKVNILRSSPQTVEYKQPEIYGDSVLSKEKKEILALVFESGYTEVVSSGFESAGKNKDIEHPVNKFSFDAFGFLGKEFYLQYERLLANGAIAVRVPLGINYNFNPDVFNYFIFRNRYTLEYDYPNGSPYTYYSEKSGIGIHSGASVVVFFNGSKKVRGYLAPGVMVGLVNRKYDIIRSGSNEHYIIGEKSNTSMLLATDVKLGFSVMTASKVSVALETGGGYGALIQKDTESQRMGIWRLSVLVGYSWNKKKQTKEL